MYVCQSRLGSLYLQLYHVVYRAVFSLAPLGEIMEERGVFDTSYPDLFPGYLADLKMAKDLAEFVRLYLYIVLLSLITM